jgi:hypothetical protein
MAMPRLPHLVAAKRVPRYLQSTITEGVIFLKRGIGA